MNGNRWGNTENLCWPSPKQQYEGTVGSQKVLRSFWGSEPYFQNFDFWFSVFISFD